MIHKIDVKKRLQEAVQSYWDARARNKEKQIESGRIDAGTRGEVTGGTQMGALEVLVADILCEAGLKRLDARTRTALELPGYFRATKKWGLIVVSEGQLVRGSSRQRQGHLDGIPGKADSVKERRRRSSAIRSFLMAEQLEPDCRHAACR